MLFDVAGLLVVGGAALGALVRDRRDAGFALVAQCLGLGLLLAAARRPVDGSVLAIVGLSGVALLRPETTGWPALNGRRPFGLAVMSLAIVGGAAVALSHPLIGVPAADVAIDVLGFGAVVALLHGDEARALTGVNGLLLAGVALLALTDPNLPRAAMFLFAVVEIGVGATLSAWFVTPAEPRREEESGA